MGTRHPAPPIASIVVPLLRQRDPWLAQCVRSAIEQTVPCEVLVVVSPLTPPANRATLERLEPGRGSPRVLAQEPDTGFAAAINTGIRAAVTDRIGFLNSDDWLEPAAVETCLRASEAEIVSTGMAIHPAEGTAPFFRRSRSRDEYARLRDPEAKANYLGAFLLFRREALLSVGGVDETIGLTGPDDYDLIWTLLETGARVEIVEEILYHYRDHREERLTLRSREEQIADLEAILDKHGVRGARRRRILREHAPWFGRPVRAALSEQAE